MRVLAIGDIHGCRRALDGVLSAAAPAGDDLVVTLGDYIDRGPDSKGVIDRLLGLGGTVKLVAIRGNHEEMVLLGRADSGYEAFWRQCGGDATIRSYGSVDAIPPGHWRFMTETCVDWYETPTHIFVHGGLDAALPLAEQRPEVLHWSVFALRRPHASGKVMVCGHTPQGTWPSNRGYAVCIDTDACRGGWLTCLDVTSGQLWQANQKGKMRQGVLRPNLRFERHDGQ